MKDQLKRWAPLVGVAFIGASTIARAWGREDVAKSIDVLGNVTGLSADSPVTASELLAVATSLVGVVVKVLNVARGK